MQLTKLEISGFKSFAKKTELIFKNGITVFISSEKKLTEKTWTELIAELIN